MNKHFLAKALLTVMFSNVVNASTLLIDFETVPVEPTGTDLFATAGVAQTITVPGVATISGGVILGDETNLPAQAFGTPPNVYGTAGFGDHLSSTLTISFNAAFPVTQASFPIFNGATISESYTITAYSGAAVVASQTLTNLAANSTGGFAIADLSSANMSSLTIAPTALNDPAVNGWDFSVDSIALNESVQQAIAPEPPGLGVLGFSAIWIIFTIKRSKNEFPCSFFHVPRPSRRQPSQREVIEGRPISGNQGHLRPKSHRARLGPPPGRKL